jgi:hypothetical protein
MLWRCTSTLLRCPLHHKTRFWKCTSTILRCVFHHESRFWRCTSTLLRCPFHHKSRFCRCDNKDVSIQFVTVLNETFPANNFKNFAFDILSIDELSIVVQIDNMSNANILKLFSIAPYCGAWLMLN